MEGRCKRQMLASAKIMLPSISTCIPRKSRLASEFHPSESLRLLGAVKNRHVVHRLGDQTVMLILSPLLTSVTCRITTSITGVRKWDARMGARIYHYIVPGCRIAAGSHAAEYKDKDWLNTHNTQFDTIDAKASSSTPLHPNSHRPFRLNNVASPLPVVAPSTTS